MDRRIFMQGVGLAASLLAMSKGARMEAAEPASEDTANGAEPKWSPGNGGTALPENANPAAVEVTVFNSGWVPTHNKIAMAGGPAGEIEMPAMFAMIRHPAHGIALYDTGYNYNFYEATRKLPYRLMRSLTPARITPEDNADRQLARAGIAPGEVKTIILGHGHVDHVPGIGAFPDAKVVVDVREWETMAGPALNIFAKGYIKSLYSDMKNPIEMVDFEAQGKPYGPFAKAVDLFDDGSMILMPLRGHTAGQMGLLVSLADGRRFFLIGDAAWLRENYLQMKPPAAPARLILSSKKDYMETLRFIRDFHETNPDAVIVPAHCPATWERLKEAGVAG